MAIQFGGFRPDLTPQYASALAALLGEQTRSRAVDADIGARDKGPDLWKQSFMEKTLAQKKDIAELQESGRQARFDPRQTKPLSAQERALQALASGSVLPGLDRTSTRMLARTLPDMFQLMTPQMEEQLKRGKEGKGRVESGDQTQALFLDLVKQLVGSQPLGNLPRRNN